MIIETIKIEGIGLKLCKIQGELFAPSLIETSKSSAIFIRRFMNSQDAQRMDIGSFLSETGEMAKFLMS